MQPYMGIVERFSKNTFFTYANLFRVVGMYQEDVLNIGRVHLVSFLGLYSLESNDKKKEEYIDRIKRHEFRTPDQKDFDQKNKANFTMFFKQRMEDLVRVCRQKSRNIKGQSSEEHVVFCGKDGPPRYPRRLLKNYEDLGYKKICFSIFKSIRKKAKVEHDATMFEFDGSWYVAIALEQKSLDIDDIVGSESNPYENAHNMQPDDIFIEKESEGLHKMFNNKSNYRKRVTLRKFVAKNQNKSQYREEVATAKKLLKGLGEENCAQ